MIEVNIPEFREQMSDENNGQLCKEIIDCRDVIIKYNNVSNQG